MDQSLLEQTANDVSRNANSVAQSVATLQDATRQLQSVIKHKFDEAVKNEDLSSIERFFKIFPLLGMHEDGLHKFSTYLCSKVCLLFAIYECRVNIKIFVLVTRDITKKSTFRIMYKSIR